MQAYSMLGLSLLCLCIQPYFLLSYIFVYGLKLSIYRTGLLMAVVGIETRVE